MCKPFHGISWLGRAVILLSILTGATAAGAQQAGDVPADPLPKGAIARLGSTRLRHTWGVRVLSFSANGKFLVSAGDETGGASNSAIRVWEMPSGRETQTIETGYSVRVRQVAVSPDGSKVIWVDSNGAPHGLGVPVLLPSPIVNPFDRRAVVPLANLPLAFSPDGKYLATGGHDDLIVMDLNAKKSVLTLRVGDFDRCVFSPDGRTLAVAHSEAGLRLVDVAVDSKSNRRSRRLPADRPGPISFAFSPDGDQLVTGDPKLVKIFDVATAKEVRRIAWGDHTALAVAFSLDGKQVTAVSDDGRVASWLVSNGREVQTFDLPAKTLPADMFRRFDLHHADVFSRIAMSADGKWFAVASQDVAVNLVNMSTRKKAAFADGQPGRHSTFGFAFTPDSKHLVTAGDDDRLQIWEARTGKLVRAGTDDMQSVYWIGVTPDAREIVSLSYDRASRGTVHLEEWSFATAKRLRQLDLGITPGIPALSPDGKWLAFGEPNDTRYRMQKTGDGILVERATGKQLRHFDTGAVSAAQDLTFSTNGKMLALIDQTSTIRIWDTATGKLLQSMKPDCNEGLTHRLCFTSDDKVLVATAMSYGEKYRSSQIVEWSVETGKPLARREGPKDIYWCQALSPDGKLFAWVGRQYRGLEEQAELWSVPQQAARQQCEGLRGGAHFLGFSPDGRLLAGGCFDGTILIWAVDQ